MYKTDRPYGFVKTPSAMRERPAPGPTKVCTKCQREYPSTTEYFYTEKLILRAICKECSKEQAKRQNKPWKHETTNQRQLRARRNQRRIEQKKREAGLTPAPSHFWTATRAGIELGVTAETVRRWIHDGKLVAVRHWRLPWRIDPASVRKLMEERRKRK